MRNTHWINNAYLALVLLSAPSALWVAFEIYGLTLFGPQMLFYSIMHTAPVLVAAIFISVIFFLVLLLVNITLVAFPNLLLKVTVSNGVIKFFFLFQVIHIAALVAYEFWAHIPVLRVITATLGLVFVFYVLKAVNKHVIPDKRVVKTDTESTV